MSLTNRQKERYYHSTFLKEITEKGQEKLLNSKIIVIGCGGLGSASLPFLVSMGVGHITIVDFDKVSLSNLPRQIMYDESEIGQYKVDVAKKKLERLNKDVEIIAFKERLTEENASKIIEGHQIVLDCTDNFETKFLINDTCMKLGIPFVIAGIRDYQGQVTTCIPGKSKDFKSLFSELPINIDEKYVKADQGVYPMSVGLIGNIASSEIVKFLLNIGDLAVNSLLIVNLLTNRFQVIKYPK